MVFVGLGLLSILNFLLADAYLSIEQKLSDSENFRL